MAERRNHNNEEGKTAVVIKAIIVCLAVILVILLAFLVWQSISLHRQHILTARELWIMNLFQHHGPPTAADVDIVRPWMTFNYVNTLFRVPPDYLQMQLQITDATYPKITIGGYAKKNGLDTNMFLQNVELTLKQYLTMVATTTATTSTQTH
jgi:hypothetical protein